MKCPKSNSLISKRETHHHGCRRVKSRTGFKVRADIDEHYISRIYPHLEGEFTFAGQSYQLVIKKVYTQVTNGRFQVDMEFINEVPDSIRLRPGTELHIND